MDHLGVGCVGIALCLYALYIEIRKIKNPDYVALCDLGSRMRCSRVLTSQYSTGFGLTRYVFGENSMLNVPNCITGIFFYLLQIALASMPAHPWTSLILYWSSILAAVGSLYLAGVLLFVLHDLCIVCFATYFVNFALLYLSHQRITHL